LKKKFTTPPAGIFWQLHQLLFAYTLLAFAVCYFVPTDHWIAGFMMLSVPVLMLLHLLFFCWFLFFNRSRAWLSGVALLLSFPFWARTSPILRTFFQNSANQANFESKPGNTFTLMSYNVLSFDVLGHLDNIEPQNALHLIEWAKTADADVKCLEEFYNHHTRPKFDIIPQFQKAGYRHYTLLHPAIATNEENFIGLAIFSKYPIVGRGEQEFENQNGMLWADLKIKNDTIRIINVHLRSYVLRLENLKHAYQKRDYKDSKEQVRGVFSRLKYGFEHHATELKAIEACIDSSPYPVIVCGDFNETPYSYVYGRLRQRLNNAFEDAGSGLGFSYRNMPNFIRIDNHFYDPKGFKAQWFETRRDVRHSDHFPIIAKYQILNN